METKQDIRRRILSVRDGMSEAQHRKKDALILERLCGLACYEDAEILLSYVSYQSEADTKNLLVRALTDGKRVYCPRAAAGAMDFYRISALTDLAPGFRGILEPFGGSAQAGRADGCFLPEEFEVTQKNCARGGILIILPGAVFDKSGRRIGYGGGYYDRYLARCAKLSEGGVLRSAALAYDLQIVEHVPEEIHDIRPQNVITETLHTCYC